MGELKLLHPTGPDPFRGMLRLALLKRITSPELSSVFSAAIVSSFTSKTFIGFFWVLLFSHGKKYLVKKKKNPHFFFVLNENFNGLFPPSLP